MKSTRAWAVVVVLGLAGAAHEQASRPTADVLYEQALAKFDWKVEGESAVLDDPTSETLHPDTAAYLAARKEIVALLKEASRLPMEAGNAEGPKQMTSLNPYRHAANLLTVQARYDMSEGRAETAMESLVAEIAIARYVGRGRTLVFRLVEGGMEMLATDQLAQMLPKVPKPVLIKLRAELQRMGGPVPFSETLKAEREWAIGEIARRNAVGEKEDLASIMKLFDAMTVRGDDAPTSFAKAGRQAAADGGASVRALMGGMVASHETLTVINTRRAMLAAAVEECLSDSGGAGKSLDPFGSGAPFTIKREAEGFTMESRLVSKGKAVTLKVGK